jgi:hypothetical protein
MPVIVISVLFTIIMSSPYIAGVLRAAPGTTFAGAVHYSLDYYYYLSYMVQGKLRWLTSIDINTQESTKPVFYHWFYVLSGRVFATFGISDILGYQLLVLSLTVLLLFVSYRLIRKVIPSRAGRITAYILFLTSNSWPYIVNTTQGWTVHYYTAWYNYGEPFIRFSSLPHHLLAQSLLIVMLLILSGLHTVSYSRSLYTWLLILGSAFLLASTQTPLVLIVLLTYGIFWVKDIIASRNPKMFLRAAVFSPILPALILLLAGAGPYMMYLRMLFGHLPYSIVISWEASQQVHPTLLQFFQVNGPVLLLGIIGLPVFLSANTRVRWIIVVCTFLSWGIFFSPMPVYISILNVRFLSVIPTLAMASCASVLIETIVKHTRRRLQTVMRIGIVVVILGLTAPATVGQVIARATFDTANAYLYLRNDVLDAYRHAEKIIKPQETCFVIWPFNVTLTGLTGRRSFIVTGYTTINYQKKEQQQNMFFSDKTPLDQKEEILKSNGISCVVTYSFTKNLPPALTPVYTNGYMTIYTVGK